MTKKYEGTKVLFYDIETFPCIMTRWGLYHEGGGFDNVLQDWSLICLAYKWEHEKTANVISIRHDAKKFNKTVHDDSHVLKTFIPILEQADILVGHNSKKFDTKKLTARAIANGMKPIAPVQQYDTLNVARAKFAFTSNRLDALGDILGVGRKIPTKYSLWLDCLKGKVSAFKEMEKYNIQDVLLLEDVYHKLAPFDSVHPNRNIAEGTEDNCPVCGGHDLQKRGFRVTRASKFQRYQCQGCGNWSSRPMSGKGVIR